MTADRRWSKSEQWLHRIATGFSPLLDISFDLERARFGKAAKALPIDRPIFVCGLARSGTSLIVRALHETGQFASPTYRDMPFALAPNSWAQLAGKRIATSTVRDHGDGLSHGLDTPEAIEELFWKHQCGHNYIEADRLVPHRTAKRVRTDFIDYIQLILLRGKAARYLSKNNNNLLRLDTIRGACPDAIIIHPFRDPLQQAASLLNQHRRACDLALKDPFRVRYTMSLAHHEFGPGHRPFCFDVNPASGDPTRLDYWLARWIDTYRHLLTPPVNGRHFIDFDRLAAAGTFASLAAHVDANFDGIGIRPVPPKLHHVDTTAPELTETAVELHRQLIRLSITA